MKMTIKHAITREPSKTFSNCLSTHPLHHSIDIKRAKEQHQKYRIILKELGVEVINLAPEREYPDSCFVEDTAIIHKDKALITRMAKTNRRGEEQRIAEILQKYFSIINTKPPATLEGGDVIHLPDRLICGITKRTNEKAIPQLQAWFNVPIDIIEDQTIMHLKSYVNYVGKDTIITTQQFKNHPKLIPYKKILVPEEEKYAANALAINDVILVAANYPNTQARLKEEGFEIIPINLSEFQKCDGAITCLSLIF
ncbi:MAG: amidinotransferase [Candidatus Heimdallarchaeota archaeon]|nr:amidinotransferase [Candidatus Heimdallarchaeota archaeon]